MSEDYGILSQQLKVLREVLEEERAQTNLYREVLEEEKKQTRLLCELFTIEKHAVVKFVVMQVDAQGDEMPIQGIAPGTAGQFTAQPVDKNGNNDTLPAGVIPAWTSSDTTNAPVTFQSPDGLSCTVTVAANAPAGTPFTLNVSATLPDATNPTGSASVPIFALEVASFVVNQTA